MDGQTKTAVLRVINDSKGGGDEEVTVQLDAKLWLQNEKGEDTYQDTRDIIFFPRIVTIKKGDEQIIRVGFQGKPATDKEKTYRLFLQELPINKPGEGVKLILALRLGVPVFIQPQNNANEIDIAIEEMGLSQGNILLQVKNSGDKHFMVGDIELAGLDTSGTEVFSGKGRGWYVLNGVSRIFTIGIPEKDCLKSDTIKAAIKAGEKTLEARLDTDTVQCQKPDNASVNSPSSAPGRSSNSFPSRPNIPSGPSGVTPGGSGATPESR